MNTNETYIVWYEPLKSSQEKMNSKEFTTNKKANGFVRDLEKAYQGRIRTCIQTMTAYEEELARNEREDDALREEGYYN